MTERRYSITPHNLTYSSEISCQAKAIYQLITAASYKRGFAYFSISYIASVLKIRRDKIVQSLQELIDRDWILALKEISRTNHYVPLDEFGVTIYPINNEKVANAVRKAGKKIFSRDEYP